MFIRRRWLLFDTMFLLLVMGYITLGTTDVPFHGDESTTIWMSRDFDTVILQGDFDAVAYEAPPRRTTNQHMRIITSNVSKLAMGLAWHSAGYSVDQINDQWVWHPDLDMTWNRVNGHMPTADLLSIMRLTSAWMTALGAVFILAAARLIARHVLNHPFAIAATGWGAIGLYAVHPAILLNGRRAMFEGGLLLGLTMVAWIILAWVQKQRDWQIVIVAGIATGIALSTKHSAAVTVVLFYFGLGLTVVLYRRDWKQLLQMALATLVALLIFLLLNPLWWSQPLDMPSIVIDQRRLILDEQIASFGGYENWSERLQGLWNESLHVAPQYYEAQYWTDFEGVQDVIADYESSIWSGWPDDIAVFTIRLALLGFGALLIIHTLRYGDVRGRRLVLTLALWAIGILTITLFTVPLGWQRYYLPIQPPLMILMGLGLGALVEWGRDVITL